MMRKLSSLALAWTLCCTAAYATDWPSYRHDDARSSVTSERIALPLGPAWTWRGAAPAPAWGEPGRSLNPLDFDYAAQPVAAGGIVVVASSADDTVRAFDAATGAARWQFTADGPVRFAPQIAGGHCFFAGDDGVARCLDVATGVEIWSKRLGVNGSQVIANGRVASRWPCRSGVLVRDGVVYVTAGMWPSEGVFVYALDAATGRERWCNDTSCYRYMEYVHAPSASFGGPAPQGALLATDDTLLVPTGRGVPAAYDLKSGRFLHYVSDGSTGAKGGTYATLLEGTVFVTAVGWEPDVPPRLGESPAHFVDSLVAFNARTGKEEWPVTASMKAVAPEWKLPHWRGQISQGLLGRTHAVLTPTRIYAFGNGKADAWDVKGKSASLKWTEPRPRVYAEALTAGALLLGENGRLVALDPETGAQVWDAPADGEVRGIAVSDGRVFASTSSGCLYVFAAGAAHADATPTAHPAQAPVPPQSPVEAQAAPLPAEVLAAVERIGGGRGFAVVFGGRDTALAQTIAARTRLHVLTVLSDAKAAHAESSRLVSRTSLYGSRLSVLAADGLELPSYFASLVVVSGDAAGVSPAEWYRVLRPAGGVMCSAGGALRFPPGLLPGEQQGAMVVRRKLPGAFDWDGKVQADERVKWPLEFTWFGEPNGQLQKPRHTRARTPLAANGRLFVFGEDTVLAVDAYSGTELWERRFDDATGQDAPARADDSSFQIAFGNAVVRVDAASGRLLEVFADKRPGLAVLDATKPLHVAGAMRPGGSCAVDVENTPDALRLLLTTHSAAPQSDDAWELAFDFRPAAQRLAAAGPGTFQLVVNAGDGSLRPLPTFAHPAPRTEKLADGRIALSFGWAELEKFAGWRPTDFLLAADCKLWNAKLDLVLWDRPLTNGRVRCFNDAQVAIVLAGAPAKGDDATLSPYLPVPVRPLSQSPLKLEKNKLAGLPLLAQNRPNADLSDFGAAGVKAPKDASLTTLPRAKGFELPTRSEPFSGETNARDYTPSYGCSGIISSATMDFLRSGCIGMYDRADDSGMRNVSGIRSGCGQTIVPALGMLLYAEGTGNCLCTYNYATSFGMAPAARQRNEDWALFNGRELADASLQHIAFNLGAPGDRRAADGTLWLALPRPELAMKLGTSISLPVTLTMAPRDGGPVRINTDRRPVAGTDKPWLYGSNVSGLQRLQIDLRYYKPEGTCLSVGAAAPKIDGELHDACWDGFGGTAAGKDATLWLRNDDQNLYLGTVSAKEAKSASFAITFGDAKLRTLIGLTVAGSHLEVRRLDVPEYDRKAPASKLPDLVPVTAQLPGAVAAHGTATEIAIPWRALEALGLNRDSLRASANPLPFFGRKPNDVTRNFGRGSFAIQPVKDHAAASNYTVRLHFCEIEGAAPGQRVFDVLLNGKPAATGLDVAASAGPMKALVKEFRGVSCTASLAVELRPAKGSSQKDAPLLSAIEVVRE